MRLLVTLLSLASLKAQFLVDTCASGVIPSGVPAQNVVLGSIGGVAWDPSGNVVFCDTTYNVIRRVSTGGILETIAGTGVGCLDQYRASANLRLGDGVFKSQLLGTAILM